MHERRCSHCDDHTNVLIKNFALICDAEVAKHEFDRCIVEGACSNNMNDIAQNCIYSGLIARMEALTTWFPPARLGLLHQRTAHGVAVPDSLFHMRFLKLPRATRAEPVTHAVQSPEGMAQLFNYVRCKILSRRDDLQHFYRRNLSDLERAWNTLCTTTGPIENCADPVPMFALMLDLQRMQLVLQLPWTDLHTGADLRRVLIVHRWLVRRGSQPLARLCYTTQRK